MKVDFKYPLSRLWNSIFKNIQACNDFIQNNPDYDIKIVFAVLDDKILAIGEETLKEIVVEEKQNGRMMMEHDIFPKDIAAKLRAKLKGID